MFEKTMPAAWLLLLALTLTTGACLAGEGVKGMFVLKTVENPARRGNEIFPAYESFYHPRIRQLRERYHLDAVVEGKQDEWERILALRHWIRSQIEIDDDNPTRCRGEAFAILDAARKGGKFHCAHFSIVQHAVLNSFGYVTRRMQCGPGGQGKGEGGNHGVNEVWVNTFCKWVLIDAKYDLHFEKDGVPLSALEIRDEVWKDGGTSVKPVVGPERKVQASGDAKDDWAQHAGTYRWCAWETDTNRFTAYPAQRMSALVVYADKIFDANTWCRDGKPHWAYNTPFFIKVTNRWFIEWTPNVVSAGVKIHGDRAVIRLHSYTPNFKTYQIRHGVGEWQNCDDQMEVKLTRPGSELSFRAVNLFDVVGPPHRVKIEWQRQD